MSRRSLIRNQAQFVDHLRIGLDEGQGHDPAGIGVFVAAANRAAEAAETASTAASAPADVVLHGVAVGDRDGLGRAHIGQRQHGVGFQLARLDAADQAAGRAADQAARDARQGRAAGVAVRRLDLGDQHVVSRLHLALPDIGAALHAQARTDVTLGHGRIEARAAVHEVEATRLLHDRAQQLGRRSKVVLVPTARIIAIGDRQGAQLAGATRHFGHGVGLHLLGVRGLGGTTLRERAGRGGGQERCTEHRDLGSLTHETSLLTEQPGEEKLGLICTAAIIVKVQPAWPVTLQ